MVTPSRPNGAGAPVVAVNWPLRIVILLVGSGAFYALDAKLFHPQLLPVVYNTLVRIGIFAILAASLNLVNGVTGQFSLGHASFMAIGAYVSGALSVAALPYVQRFSGWQSDAAQVGVFLAGMVAAVIVASIAGLIVGLPTLRLRGDYLAIATLGFGQIVVVVFKAWDKPFGGAVGLIGVPTVTNLFWAAVAAVICLLLLRNLQWSGPGRDMMAVREDEVAATAVGVDVVRTKVVAFIVAAAFAGMAGVLFVHFQNGVNPDQANFIESIRIVVMVVLGGMGSLTGSVLGAALLTALTAGVENTPFATYENIIYPVLLILLMLVRREGLLGTKELAWRTVGPFFTRWRKMEKL